MNALLQSELVRAALALGLLAAVCARPRPWSDLLRAALRCAAGYARSPASAVACAALLGFAASALVACCVQWPQPRIHDEFSYLLAADTFARGRLANPTPDLWQHFESFHVIFEPHYASKYPPAQGLVLALGQVLGGTPVVGLWLASAFFCGALCWLLLAFLPARWALLGAALAALRFCAASYWGQSFWGGALAAAGGALVLGGTLRVLGHARGAPRQRAVSASAALALAAGLCVLSNSRPFEGLAAALPSLALLAYALVRRRAAQPLAWRVWTSAVVLLAFNLAWIAFYNARVSGSALRLPYAVHDAQYAVAPPFLWLPLAAEPEYRHAVLREFWTGFALEEYASQRSFAAFAADLGSELARLARFLVGGLLTLPLACALLAALLARLRRPRAASARGAGRLALPLATIGCVLLALAGLTYRLPHYAAPAFAALWLLIALGLRALGAWRALGARRGRALTALVLLLSAGSSLRTALAPARPEDAWERERAQLVQVLEAQGGRHLVFVRYPAGHSPHEEWVYNGAELAEQSVLWARDLGEQQNARLLRESAQARGRSAWKLEAPARGEPVLERALALTLESSRVAD
jgi:hypothetical protein